MLMEYADGQCSFVIKKHNINHCISVYTKALHEHMSMYYIKHNLTCYKLIFSRTESIFVRKTSFRLISVKTSSGLRKMFSQYYYNQNGVWENVCPTILDTHFH